MKVVKRFEQRITVSLVRLFHLRATGLTDTLILAFLEFKNLRPLISVHGRWNFLRMSQLIYYSFYKNIAMITVYWLYGFSTLWSGTNVYEETFLVYFNVAFSAVPPFVVACFEKDVARTPLFRYPELYRESRVHYWNLWTFVGWIASAVYVSIIMYFVGFGIWGEGALGSGGRTAGYNSSIYVFSSMSEYLADSTFAKCARILLFPLFQS